MSNTPSAAPEGSPAQPGETIAQGWEKFAGDVADANQQALHALLRFTYFHASFDTMARIQKINAAGVQHRDVNRVRSELNALVTEINAFLADEANIPTAIAPPEPEPPRLILPPGAGRL